MGALQTLPFLSPWLQHIVFIAQSAKQYNSFHILNDLHKHYTL